MSSAQLQEHLQRRLRCQLWVLAAQHARVAAPPGQCRRGRPHHGPTPAGVAHQLQAQPAAGSVVEAGWAAEASAADIAAAEAADAAVGGLGRVVAGQGVPDSEGHLPMHHRTVVLVLAEPAMHRNIESEGPKNIKWINWDTVGLRWLRDMTCACFRSPGNTLCNFLSRGY